MRMLQVDVTVFYNPNSFIFNVYEKIRCPVLNRKVDFSPPARQLDCRDFKSEILQILKSSNLNRF